MGDVVEQMTGLIPVVITAGVVTKMTDNMLGSKTAQHKEEEEERPIKKKCKKKYEENGYTRNNAVFGSEKYRPF